MTREEAIEEINKVFEPAFANYIIIALTEGATPSDKALKQQPCEDWYDVPSNEMTLEQARQAVKDLRKKLAEYLEQKPCEDCISRHDALNCVTSNEFRYRIVEDIKALPPVTPKEKTGHCKDCKHFEYDHIENVSGIPLILAHEICSRWGDGCKTKEDGYCFLFESQESEDKK